MAQQDRNNYLTINIKIKGKDTMPQITLNRKKLVKFSDFMNENKVENWFLAKDDGAYIGAVGEKDGKTVNCLFYFNGMNPELTDEAYDNALYAFGGDDFGEHFPSSVIHDLVANEATTKMVLKATETSISISSWVKN